MDLLINLFTTIYIPQAVHEEVTYKTHPVLPSFIQVIEVKKINLLDELLLLLDQGESEAISLAKEKQLPLIIDEKKGRKVAINLKIKIIGLLGVIYLNIKNNYISKVEAGIFLF